MSNRIGTQNMELVRLYEKVAMWTGLSENTGPILAALLDDRYGPDEWLSADELGRRAGYSRAHTGLVLSQLDALEVIESRRDYTQSKRGRRRLLYGLKGGIDRLLALGIKRMLDRLEGMLTEISEIRESGQFNRTPTEKALKDLAQELLNQIESFRNHPTFQTVS